MWSLSFEWLLLAVLVFWVVGAYKRLSRLRASCIQQFGALDAHLGQWLALLQQYQAESKSEDRPAAQVHAEAALEQTLIQLQSALAEARSRPLRETALASLEHSCSAVNVAWQAVLSVMLDEAEEVQQASMAWQKRWAEHQVRNHLGLQHFNQAVNQYNTAIAQYPARLLAGLLGLRSVRALAPMAAALNPQEIKHEAQARSIKA
ncbi:LemA protein [Comamonas composti]|uniref:LemA protein n=1 Tax=Comamonas composti TaxID=408558 RepID=UPI00040AA90E|nr:LemA protein [Comamonas composti]